MPRTCRNIVFGLLVALATPLPAQAQWPQFRGPNASGLGTGNPPVRWDVATGENILWSIPIEGLAHSSPIVWDDVVLVTTAVSGEMDEPELGTGWLGGTGEAADDTGRWSWQVHCYGLEDGQLRWKQEAVSGLPLSQRHLKATHANCTPACNGDCVVAFFGSEGLFCFDMEGNLRWKTGFGRLDSGPYNAPELQWSFASSPVIHGQHVIVQCDCLNTSFVAVLRLADGVEVRRIPRSDVATWSTPLVVPTDNGTQVVCNGYREMAGYILETGERLWYLSGGGDIPVPTPVFAQGLILLTNGHGRSPTFAVSPAARGDITPPDSLTSNEQITDDDEEPSDTAAQLPPGLAWFQSRDGSYMPTPIAVGDYLYTCNDNGRLVVRDLRSGTLIYKERVGGRATFSASGVGTTDRLYFADEAGWVYVVRTGSTFELLAENKMDEIVMATPALAGDRLLIRTTHQLFCIGQSPPP